MLFEWDEKKNRLNKSKHKLSFELARRVWDDPDYLLLLDGYVDGEERWLAIGRIQAELLIVAVHTYRGLNGKEVIRLISARKATRSERNQHDRKTAD